MMKERSMLLFANENNNMQGLVQAGSNIAHKSGIENYVCVLVGPKAKRHAEELKDSGADVIVAVEGNSAFPETISTVLQQLTKKYQPVLITMSSDVFNKEVAARLAASLDKGCITDCIDLSTDENANILADRLIYGGIAVASYVFDKEPAICTLSQSFVGKIKGKTANSEAKIIYENVDFPNISKDLIGSRKIERTVDLSSSEIVVSVGRGLNKKEDIAIIEDLAKELNAEIGCSRPLSEDFKWLPVERQVGLTGETIKPKLYFAIGISGQIQHVVGAKDAKIIVAINNNKNAPIFDVADYGIKGDLYEIVPKLTETIRAKKQS